MLIHKFNRNTLWEGCILTTIAHAVMVEQYLELSNEQSWDGMNYSVQDSCGCRGTITFHKKYLVAVFQDNNNKKMMKQCIEKGAIHILGIQQKIIEDIADKEALQYVLDDFDGITVPLVTTGFWGINNDIFSKYEYEVMEENGAYILANQIKSFEENIQALIDYYDMSEKLVRLAESIYFRKIRNPNNKIQLHKNERNILLETYGIELSACKQTFKEINIFL